MEESRTCLTEPPLRIAYLVSQYPTVTHTFVLREIRGLRRIGFDISVASIRAADRPFEELSEEERDEQRAAFYIKPAGLLAALRAHLRVFVSRPLGYFRALVYALRLSRLKLGPTLANLFYFAEAVVLIDWMKKLGLAQLHTHFSTTVALIARRIMPIRMSATIHGSDEFKDPAGFYLREKIETFDMLRTISEYGRRQLEPLSRDGQREKLRVSRLGVDSRIYESRPFRWNPARFELISVGRLVPLKGLRVLIAAVKQLLCQGRELQLRLVGDGSERETLERYAGELGLVRHVIFEGWVNADGVRDLYKQADIFALASLAEGIPVVLMEAMAMEIPCVATAITGIPELIHHEVNGLLVPPSDEDKLALALARLMDDPELRLRLGKSARRRVLESYDLNCNNAAFAGMLREVHGSGRRGC